MFVTLTSYLKLFYGENDFLCWQRVQLHFEDSDTPLGESGGINYRPDGTPTKVGLWMLMVQDRCLIYLPGNKCAYDEGTARYNGKMSRLKHRQNSFKPYDGFRIYMLNDSTTG